jgi:multidrug resistance efflux pump
MAFIETDETIAGVQINQNFTRYIAPGQPVELAFKFLPGKIYTGHVIALLQATTLGQLQVSGSAASPVNIQALPFAVRIEIDDPTLRHDCLLAVSVRPRSSRKPQWPPTSYGGS